MNSNERLKQLEVIETELAKGLQSAGQAIQELAKEKPSQKQVETHSLAFLRTLERVEGDISKQIHYLNQVSTGQPHEGSAYASRKVHMMARHRLDHTKMAMQELEHLKQRHHQEQQQLHSSFSATTTASAPDHITTTQQPPPPAPAVANQ